MTTRLLLFLAALLALAPTSARADDVPGDRYAEQGKSDKVALRVMVVHATSVGNKVDSRLQNLTKSHEKLSRAERLFDEVNGFLLRGETGKSLFRIR